MNLNFFVILLWLNFVLAGEDFNKSAGSSGESVKKMTRLRNEIREKIVLNPIFETFVLLDKNGNQITISKTKSPQEIKRAIKSGIGPFSANSSRTKYVILCFKTQLSEAEVKALFTSDCEWPDFSVKTICLGKNTKDTVSSVLVEHMKTNYKLLSRVLAKIRNTTVDNDTFHILLKDKLAAKEPIIALKKVNGSFRFCNPTDSDVEVVVSYKSVMFNQEEIPLSELDGALKGTLDRDAFRIVLERKLYYKEPIIALKKVNGSFRFCNPTDSDAQVAISRDSFIFNQKEIPLSELDEALKDNIIYFVGEKGCHMNKESEEHALFKTLQPDFQGTSR